MIAAQVEYWRVQRSAWGECLALVKGLGFEVVSTPVPWGVHEVEKGRLDWSGARDLGAFLEEVERAGMTAILQPGPHGEETLTHWGYPERVLRDEEMLARTARGTPAWVPAPPHMFPVPSYASRAFRAAAGEWLRAVGAVIAPRVAPRGPVVALRILAGLEKSPRGGAFDLDYHADAIAWWREHASETIGEVEPPRAWSADDAARCAEWVRFKERYAARARAWISDELDAGGLAGVARLGGAGAPVTDVTLGGPPWFPPVPAAAQIATAVSALAGGARALVFAGVVDRDRWQGAPVTAAGALRPPADDVRGLVLALDRVDWPRLRRRTSVGLVASRADARFAVASSAADPLPPLLGESLGLGPAGAAELSLDRSAALHRRWLAAASRALADADLPFAILDEDSPDDAWAAHDLFVAPTLGRVDRALWRRLRSAGERGARVILGPERPERDELDRPLGDDAALPRRAGLMRPGSLDDVAGLSRDLAHASSRGALDFRRTDGEAGIDFSVFEDSDGVVRALTVGSTRGDPVRARLTVPVGTVALDALSSESFAESAGAVEISLFAYQVRLMEVKKP